MTEPMITVSLADLRLALRGFGVDDPAPGESEAHDRLWNLPGMTLCATCKHDQFLHCTEDSRAKPCETCGCRDFAMVYLDHQGEWGAIVGNLWIMRSDPEWNPAWDVE